MYSAKMIGGRAVEVIAKDKGLRQLSVTYFVPGACWGHAYPGNTHVVLSVRVIIRVSATLRAGVAQRLRHVWTFRKINLPKKLVEFGCWGLLANLGA